MADELKRKALALWERAQRFHLAGELERAIELYSESIDVFPTAEAHTFRGWAYSFLGKLDVAIAECKRAIDVDASFGNPYNDIGSYLMAQGELDEAVEWLEKAKTAERYEPRHFPFMNLARLFARKGMISRALEEIAGALELRPDEPTCLRLQSQLRNMLN